MIRLPYRRDDTAVPNDTGLLLQCNPGLLLVTEIQRQGKKAMPTEELLRGFEFVGGETVG